MRCEFATLLHSFAVGENMTSQKMQQKCNIREGGVCLKCKTDFGEDSEVL